MGGGADQRPGKPLAGEIVISTPKSSYKAGEEIEIIVEGRGLQAVNALSFALPYEAQQLEFFGVEAPALEQMRNFTNDRLHTSGQKALYPTFVNIGDREEIEGDVRLMVIRFRARTDYRFDLKPVDGLLVNKRMDQKPF